MHIWKTPEVSDYLLQLDTFTVNEFNPLNYITCQARSCAVCGNIVYVDRDMQLFAGYHTIINSECSEDNKYLACLFKADAWRSQVRSKGSGAKLVSISRKTLGEAR